MHLRVLSRDVRLLRLFGLLLGMSLISCEQQGPMEDLEPPRIEVLAPTAQATMNSRDSVQIHVKFTENTQLHDLDVWVWKLPERDYVANFLYHEHLATKEIQEAFWYPVSDSTELELEVYASDHNGNADSLRVNFWLLP